MRNCRLTIRFLMSGLAFLLNLYFLTDGVYAKDDQNTKVFDNKSGQSTLYYQTQKRLKDLGYDPGPIDGIWGGKTQRAVNEFQRDNNLSATGQLDEETKKKLGLKGSTHTSDEEKWEAFRVFADAVEILQKEYYRPVSTKEMIIEATKWLVDSLDQKSQLYTPEDLAELAGDKSATTGIGVNVVRESDFFVVVATIPGTPARKYGIKPGDKIVMIDGKATWGMRKDEVLNRLRGPIGSELNITISRDKLKELNDLTIIRDAPEKAQAYYFTLLDPGYGYLRLSRLDKGASSRFKNALENLKEEDRPLKGLILDLRNSSGGLLKQAIEISDIFLDKGTIVRIKGRNKGNIKIFKASSSANLKKDFPVVVLINSGTFSGSEIIAAALQDNKRAILLGAKSSGSGSIQTIEKLPGGFVIRLTIARFFTPNGQSIEKYGIDPNILIDSDFDTSLYTSSIPSFKNDVILKTAYQVIKSSPSSQFEDLLSTAEKILKKKERLANSKASISYNENANAEVKYVTDILNVALRAGPRSDEKILGVIKTGQEFEIMQSGDKWTKVKLFTGKQGWILTRYIVPSPYLLFDISPEFQNRAYITDTIKLTVRDGPGTKHKILSIVESRQRVEIISTNDDWSLIRTPDGKEGWTLSRYLIDYPRDRWCVEGNCVNGSGIFVYLVV